jgi:hypothetical protein
MFDPNNNQLLINGYPFGTVVSPPFSTTMYRTVPVEPVLPSVIQSVLAQPLEEFASMRNARAFGKPLTHAGLILDESGSMLSHQHAALEGYNAQVGVIKQGAQGAGKTLVSLNVFSSVPRQVLSTVDVEHLLPLGAHEYRPSGGTALYDALGDMIALFLSQPGAYDPNTAFLVSAFTDGGENSSTRYNAKVLKDVITRLEATGRWTFTLMGPQGSTQEMASVLNLNAGNIAAFDPSRQESVAEAFSTMTMASSGYMNLRASGAMASNAFYSSVADEK